MAQSMGFEKIRLFNKPAMKRLAVEHIGIFVRRVRAGVDAFGSKLKGYSQKYAEIKGRGFERIDGKGRLKSHIGIPIISRKSSGPADLTVTGRTMRDLNYQRHTKDSYVIGWRGEPAAIVAGQKEQERDIISTIPDKEWLFLMNRLGVLIDKEFNKLKNVKVHIKI